MRKIEKDMLHAIERKRSWAGENTTVRVDTGHTRAEVLLHGNHIADVWYSAGGSWKVEVNKVTLGRWPTATTKSRLRALGVNLTQRDFQLFIDGVAIAWE